MTSLKKALAMASRQFVPGFVASLWYLFRYGARVSSRAEVDITGNFTMGPGCTVSSFAKVKALHGPLAFGARCGLASGCFVSAGAAGIRLGDDVLCGPNVVILGRHYLHGELAVPFEEQGRSSKGVTIGSNVWIGANSVVTDGARIGSNTIVAAGSLLNRRYPDNVILQGSPARIVMRRDRAQVVADERAGAAAGS